MELIIKNHPTLNFDEIFKVLTTEYASKNYSVFKFGFGPGKSIVVGKSFSVGVRVYLKPNNLIVIAGEFGSKRAPLLGVGLIIVTMLNRKEKSILEKEVCDFILSKYN